VKIMERYGIVLGASTIEGTNYRTDGHLRIGGRVILLVEGKNEIGSTGAEPIFQGLAYYASVVGNPASKPSDRFPMFLIFVVGSIIGVTGIAFTDRPNAQILIRPFHLSWHSTDLDTRAEAARCFGALKEATRSLGEHQELGLDPSSDPRFPYPFEYTDSDTTSRRFKFEHQLSGKLVFFGRTSDDDKICIKFTRSYSKTVHLQCAARGRAPALKGFQQLAGGWYMIVMDDLRDSYRHPSDSLGMDRPSKAIKALLLDLHQSGYVHGDIRSSNIMVGDNEDDFMLVDFDWAGRIGEARYPMNLNRSEGLWRPDGARDGAIILADHDIEMLEFIIRGPRAS